MIIIIIYSFILKKILISLFYRCTSILTFLKHYLFINILVLSWLILFIYFDLIIGPIDQHILQMHF